MLKKLMEKSLMLVFLSLTIGAGQAIFAQELEDNCAIEAWITDNDPNGLNVRDKPNVKGKILTKLKSGEGDDAITVFVTGYSNGWMKIGGATKVGRGAVFNDIGWVSAKMIAVEAKGEDDYDAPAPLYAKPSKSSKKVGTIPSGTTQMQIVGYDCFGLKVIYKGVTGWLSAGNICGSPVTNCN